MAFHGMPVLLTLQARVWSNEMSKAQNILQSMMETPEAKALRVHMVGVDGTMKVIAGKYKTTKIIRIAAERHGYIVCRDQRAAHDISLMAQEMGLRIVFPITFFNFIKGGYHGRGIKEFYIDDVGDLLASITSVPIYAISLSGEPADT